MFAVILNTQIVFETSGSHGKMFDAYFSGFVQNETIFCGYFPPKQNEDYMFGEPHIPAKHLCDFEKSS